MGDIGDLGCYHLRVGGTGEEQELVGLVGADVRDDPAEAGRIPEPRWSLGGIQPVRAEPHRLEWCTDGAVADQLRGADGRRVADPLAVIDAVDAARFGLD